MEFITDQDFSKILERLENIEKIATALGTNVSQLFAEVENETI